MLKILLLNDIKLYADIQRSFLKRLAIRMIVARDCAEILEKARLEVPDIVIIDLSIAGTEGYRCCEEMKSMPETKDIPLIFIASAEEAERCMRAGSDDIIMRPVTKENFLRIVTSYLDLQERSTARIRAVKRIRCNMEDSSARVLYSKDLSSSGIFLKCKDPLDVGSYLEMDFRLAGKGSGYIHAAGEVVRKVEYERDSHLISGMGIRFKELQPSDRLRIQGFVDVKDYQRTRG